MAEKRWTLTDVVREIYTDQISLGPGDVAGSPDGWRVVKQTLRGGLRDRVDVISVQNGIFQFVVVPTRGMGLWRGKCEHLEIGWHSPVRGPVHPGLVPLEEPSGFGWLAGFDELLCRCGLESNGAPEFDESGRLVHGLHGRIANLPAQRVEVGVDTDAGQIQVHGIVDEARLFGTKLRLSTTITTRFDSKEIAIRDTVTNLAATPVDAMLLYHVNFGPPLLGAGAKTVVPAKKIAPVNDWAAEGLDGWSDYAAAEAGRAEQCYFFELASDAERQTEVMLRDPGGRNGVSLRFNVEQLPCFTIWKNTEMPSDGYVTGLEPGINFPTTRTFEAQQGRGRRLSGGESFQIDLRLVAHTDSESVSATEARIAELQQGTPPEVCRKPVPEWSAS